MEDVTVIVATFGSHHWRLKGDETARHHGAMHYHHTGFGMSLGAVRNRAVEMSGATGWICFIDADDWLEPGYLDAMGLFTTWTDMLLAPKLRLGLGKPQKLWLHRDIMETNPCCIGTLIHRDVFDDIGGFWDEPAWEDWSLFRRAVLAGATICGVDDATYCAWSSPDGRNSTIENPTRLHRQIKASHKEWMKTR